MARTRITLNSTKFLNSKRRVIGMTANGKYAARTEKGGLTYNPKAKYVKSPGGTERTLLNSKANVPTAIRPKMVRKARSNTGAKRAPRAGVHAGNLARLFSSPKRRGRPPKPGGPKKYVRKEGLRKTRSNKGVKRGSRKEKAMFARLTAPLN